MVEWLGGGLQNLLQRFKSVSGLYVVKFKLMKNTVVCPVDQVNVDENKVRFTAFLVLVIAITYLAIGNWLLIAILLVDFALRAFNLNVYSPLAILGGAVINQIKLKPKPVDRAPKRFATFVGLVFLAAILTAHVTGFLLTARLVSGVLILFAALESLAGFCAGCYVYSWLIRFKLIT